MENYKENVKVFKALCDEKRLKILELLKNGEKCSCDIGEKAEIAQSSMSYHMKILCESGIVSSRTEGKWTHYTISEEGRQNAAKILLELTSVDLNVVNTQEGGCCE